MDQSTMVIETGALTRNFKLLFSLGVARRITRYSAESVALDDEGSRTKSRREAGIKRASSSSWS